MNVIYRLTATCSDTHESEVRHILLTAVAERPVVLRALRTEDVEEDHEIRLRAEIESPRRDETLLEEMCNGFGQTRRFRRSSLARERWTSSNAIQASARTKNGKPCEPLNSCSPEKICWRARSGTPKTS